MASVSRQRCRQQRGRERRWAEAHWATVVSCAVGEILVQCDATQHITIHIYSQHGKQDIYVHTPPHIHPHPHIRKCSWSCGAYRHGGPKGRRQLSALSLAACDDSCVAEAAVNAFPWKDGYTFVVRWIFLLCRIVSYYRSSLPLSFRPLCQHLKYANI